ncbi:hypothetical protein [Spiroplasma endosymbiont of Nebria brevicollis]|uniref:hypothetical protein n=1 Tax=Spiroplasma endosymbiont of Nebria brevicollis TaxID=3066284 RepID=UPI00313D5CD7
MKKVENENIELQKWYVISWVINYNYDIGNLVNFRRTTKVFLSVLDEDIAKGIFTLYSIFYVDELGTKRLEKGVRIAFDTNNKQFTSFGYNHPQYTPNTGAMIEKIYQYQGFGTPTEFIAETNNDDNYYTKQETNELLDKKQDKLTAGTNITIKDNIISASGGEVDLSNYYKKEETNNLLDKKESIENHNNDIKSVELKISQLHTEVTNNMNIIVLKQNIKDDNLQTTDKTITGAINENKTNIDKKQDKLTFNNQFKNENNTISLDTEIVFNKLNISNVNTIDKTVSGAINEIYKLIPKWKKVGEKVNDYNFIRYNFKLNTLYKVSYSWNASDKGAIIFKTFLWKGDTTVLDYTFWNEKSKKYDVVLVADKPTQPQNLNGVYINSFNSSNEPVTISVGEIISLEEEVKENTYEIKSNTLDIKQPKNINITKPLHINSNTLNIKEIAENTFGIELKSNPIPTPCPCPKWKEVALSTDGFTIKYDLKENTKYRIY